MSEGSETLSRKQIEFAKREQEILKAAVSLFENPHWETVTVEQISKKAEIGKGTVYKHFGCKEEIYARISISFLHRMLAAYDALPEQSEPVDVIREIIRVSFEQFLENPAEARVSFYCKRFDFRERLTAEYREEFDQVDELFASYIGSILEPGIESGLFPEMPIEQLTMGLEATFDGAISTIWNGGLNCLEDTDLETYINIISEYMVAGLVGLAKKELK
jgi:AcrR family transcriptional regulator